ncbi:MAG: diguanylate cyclase [Gammaproteobacteria bacterium]|nr:diguanylate cyclase [Gammaproteobacteria bacterium]MBU1731436.1 diguanylate cyclase [Gammaproteobacteria bacterium]MBU1892941.1 diguanylate cyclase [Gammaproteobacteria bacterium]
MAKLDSKLFGDINFGIAIKLGILLAAFGVLASGLTGYYTFQATRDILIREASQDLLHSTQVLGRRFSIMAGEVANDARFLAQLPRAHEVFGSGNAAEISRQSLSEEFRSLLSVHPEYFQARFISAVHNGIELIRVDRDANSLRIISDLDLQEKLHYPYAYETLRLPEGQVHFSRIVINREEGAHAGLKQPTLQVATPVMGHDGGALGVIVINVDLNRLFGLLKADLGSEYQLYLANQAGDFLIHPDSAMTFGFDYGRRFLVQDTFKPVAAIVDKSADTAMVRTLSAEQHDDVIGGFARIPFGDQSGRRFVIIGLTVPLNSVLAETDVLARDSRRIVFAFSVMAIVLSILVAFIFVRPVKRLVAAVRSFAETHELTPVPVHSRDELGLLARSIGQMQEDILAHLNDLEQRNDEMEHRAQHDALTGAPNRVMFHELLQFSIGNARRNGSQLAVLFIDLDHFKEVNDTYGHAAGDAILIEVARRLKTAVRESDAVARLSGDEFVVMIQPVDDPQQLAVIAQKLIKALQDPIEFEGQSLHISASIGISVFPGDGDDMEQLLHNADTAMYHSKRKGRNTFHFYA